MEIHIHFKNKQTFKNIKLQTPNIAALAVRSPLVCEICRDKTGKGC